MTGKDAALEPGQEEGRLTERREASLPNGLAWLPIPIFIIAIGVLTSFRFDANWNPPVLIPALNIIFGITCTFFVFVLATKSYLAGHSRTILFLGCAMLAAGLGVLAGAVYTTIGHNVDMNMAIIASMMCVSGLCDMVAATGSLLPEPKRLRSGWQLLLTSYLIIIIIFTALLLLIQYQFLPIQYINGAGNTLFGVFVYGLAVILIGLAGILLMLKRTGEEANFRRWYGMGLVLIAVGLFGVSLQITIGDAVNWAGRTSEYIGAVYLLIAVVSSARRSGEWLLPIEKSLLETEARYKKLVEMSPDAILVYSGGKCVFANLAASGLFCASPSEEIVGRDLIGLVHPDLQMSIRPQLELALSGITLPLQESRFVRLDGRPIDVEIVGTKVEFGGKPAIQIIIRDITRRKDLEIELQQRNGVLEAQTEELEVMNEELEAANEELRANNDELALVTRSLQDSEGRLREANGRFDLVLNQLTDYFAICDVNWRFLYVNEAYARNLRKSREELLGQCVWDLIPQAVGTINYENSLKTAEDRMPRTWTSSVTFPDRVLEYRTFAWHEGVALLTRDITKERRAETALLDSEWRYRSLFENIQEGFYLAEVVFDEMNSPCDFIYLDVNPAFERIMGIRREQMLGRRATDVVPDLAPHWIAAFGNVAVTGMPLQYNSYSEVFKKHFGVFVFRPAGGQFAALVMDITESKRAEETLRESEEKYRTFFENNIDAVLITAPDGSIYTANAEACRIFAMTEEEIKRVGRDGVVDLSDPRLKLALEERSRTGKFIGELNYRRKDGTIFPGEVSTSYYKDKDGRIKTAMVIRDITRRKLAEETRQIILQRFYTILSGMYAAILLVTEDGTIEFTNRAFCDYFNLKDRPPDLIGLTSDEMLGKIRSAYRYPDEAVARIREIVRHGQPVNGEEIAMQGRTCLRDYIPLFVDGKPQGRLWLHLDITSRKLTEETMRETSNYLESLINYANAPIIVWDPNFNITRFNHAFEHLTGYTSDEVNGKELDMLFPRESNDSSLVKIKRTLAGEYWQSVEIPILRKDGNTRIALWNSANIYGEDGVTLLATIAQGQDITDRKRVEEELYHAKVQAELYLDLMGHDISNMHQIAMGQLELAQDAIKTDGKLEATDREMIDTSLASLERSARLIDNVRKLQRIRSDGVKNNEISLDEVLAGVIKQYDVLYPEKVVRIDSAKGPHIVKANELLQDVFTNLVGNAIKHSNGNAVDILVKLEDAMDDSKKYYKVSIEDNGPGIPDGMKDKIFNRLQRGETEARGMGLGLYLVKSLVDSYNGKVWVEDRVYGDHTKGSRFVVMLPEAYN